VTAADRFRIVAPLPSPRGHLHVAVDQASRPPRAVVLAFHPRAASSDPARLERLAVEAERAAQLVHPSVVAPVAVEAVGDDLAVVTVWRDAVTLREVLDAGGRLPCDVAARIAADVCAGVGYAHGRAEPVVHGQLATDAVLLDASGTAAVSGFGMADGAGVSDDLRASGELLHESLAGTPPEQPSAPLDAPGIPAALAAVVNQARAAEPEARFATAEALGKAIVEAIPLASRADVAAYLEAVVPAGMGLRAQRRKRIETAVAAASVDQLEEISDQDIVCAPTPAPTSAQDVTAPTPVQAAAVVTPAPAPAAVPASAPATVPVAAPVTVAAPVPIPEASAGRHRPADRERDAGRGVRVPLWVAFAMFLVGGAMGVALPRLASVGGSVPAPARPGAETRASGDASGTVPAASVDPAARTGTPARAPARPAAASAPKKKRASVRHAAARADAQESRPGLIAVTAPDGAEVWLDGRRIGTGNTQRRIPEGHHRIEVRHRGATVSERFHVGPGETWTYAVTPK
jgi:hypothetical protein